MTSSTRRGGHDVRTEPLELIFDHIKDYAVFMVSLDGKIASWNTGAQRLKGYGHNEAIGLPFSALFTPEDIGRRQPETEMRVALEEGVYEGEGTRVRKDGSRFEAAVTLRVIRSEGGEPLAYVKITRDITERRRLERIERDRAEFEQQLIGMVSHDLRNPLNAIHLSAARLLTHSNLGVSEFRAVERIVVSTQKAIRLVRDLLDFTQARLGHGIPVTPTPFNLHEFVALLTEELREANPGRQIEFDEGPGNGGVSWDPDRISQVVGNLVTNALVHGDRSRPVRVTTRTDGDSAIIEVHNFGEPIPPALLRDLFKPMRRVATRDRGRGESIGLGLYIVSHIVDGHGGRIEVASNREGGTTFRVIVPREVEGTSATPRR